MRLRGWCSITMGLAGAVCLADAGCGGAGTPLALRKVVLYQNGVGYFERRGELRGDHYSLQLRRHEVGDVLKSMVVIDSSEGRQRAVSAVLPAPSTHKGGDEDAARVELLLRGQGPHSMDISYAAPTPVWKPSYRVVLPDVTGGGTPGGTAGGTDKAAAKAVGAGLLQAWAIVNNASGEPWRDVELVLATGAPLSFAVDLQTPHFVARPDGNGRLVQPVATGLVEAERGRAVDSPIGGGSADRDGDGILDQDDKCPAEPETFNGIDDADGCPDRGRVMISESRLEILDKIYFRHNSSEIQAPSQPILDALAATLSGNPQLTQVEIQGHACAPEGRARELGERRAAGVREQLIRRGVAGHRLTARGYGSDRPVAAPASPQGCDRNRRVEFAILQQREGEGSSAPSKPAAPAISADSVAGSARPGPQPSDIAGASYYKVSDPVSLPRGASTMVSMLTLRGGTEDVYLFRPDGHVRGSERHPLRAARLHIGLALEPGPVSVFARGSFVGEGALERMHAGETALVPYALDSAASIEVHREEATVPLRLVSLHSAEAVVEDEQTRTTRYEITPGATPPARIFIRHGHGRSSGYAVTQLPPDAEEGPEAYLLPQPLLADRKSELTLVEKRPLRHVLPLRKKGASICPYLTAASYPPALQTRLHELCELQNQADRADGEQPRLRQQLDDLRERADDLRSNLHAIEKIAAAATLRADLLAKLGESERRSAAIQKQLIERSEAQATLEAKLVQALSDLQVDESSPARMQLVQ